MTNVELVVAECMSCLFVIPRCSHLKGTLQSLLRMWKRRQVCFSWMRVDYFQLLDLSIGTSVQDKELAKLRYYHESLCHHLLLNQD